jgi:site-specific recombinase XerD
LTAIRCALTIDPMQLELWQIAGQAVAPAHAPRLRSKVARHAPVVAAREAVTVAVARIDPALMLESQSDPELARLQARALEFVQESKARTTRKAYSNDWKLFEIWCHAHGQVALPATPATLALYLTHLASCGRKYSTIRRARIAIGQIHCAAHLPRPDQDRRIRVLERGIGRTIGTREQGASPLCVAELERAVNTLNRGSLRDTRDRALLLLGFACGYRASDLVTLDAEHVHVEGDALRVFLPRSKEDQLARGRTTIIPAGAHKTLCPVAAVQGWLERAQLSAGPLFRAINGHKLCAERMHPRAVSRAVQRAVKRAGVTGAYSSHSLRAGLATSADAHGHSLRAIQQHVGWLDARTPARYIDSQRGSARHILSGLL